MQEVGKMMLIGSKCIGCPRLKEDAGDEKAPSRHRKDHWVPSVSYVILANDLPWQDGNRWMVPAEEMFGGQAEKPQGFSAVETCWRRERDSNPRYRFRYSGFQDRLFQPLTHPSA